MKILQKPEVHAVIGVVGGMLIGISQDSYGLGVALALALGTGVYAVSKKKKNEDITKTDNDS